MPKTKDAKVGDEYFEQLATSTDDTNVSGWMNPEYNGQLAVDVYENEHSIIIRAAIAGVRSEDIDISVSNDMVTVKGIRRVEDEDMQGTFLYQECYWGGFSRSIVLPVEVKPEGVDASLKNGVLTIVLPKAVKARTVAVKVDSDEDET